MFHKLSDRSQKGQGLVEYALILVLVAVVVIVILSFLGPAIGGVFSDVLTELGGVPGGGGAGSGDHYCPGGDCTPESFADAFDAACTGQPDGTPMSWYYMESDPDYRTFLVSGSPTPSGYILGGEFYSCGYE